MHPLRAAAGHRRAIKSTGVVVCGRIRLVVILHPAYQLMRASQLKEMKLVNFPATYQTSVGIKAGVVTVINVAEALLIEVPEPLYFKPVQRLAPVRRGSAPRQE